MPFSEKEFKSFIMKYNKSSTSGPKKLSWRYLKAIVNDSTYLKNFINIDNMCINLGYWLLHFKTSSSIIIPKLNKAFYDSPKMFRLIMLLNTISKLIENIIGKRL